MARIRLDNVGFTYPGADAATLAPLSMDISHGEPFRCWVPPAPVKQRC